MPTALSDPSSTLYAFLVIIVFVLAAIWMRRKSRWNLVRLLIGAGVLTAVFLIDWFVESPREEAVRKVKEMAQVTQNGADADWNAFLRNVSDSFKYKGPNLELDKESLRGLAKRAGGIPQFKGVLVWDFNRADFKPIDNENIKIGFQAKPKEVPLREYEYWVAATFHRDPDGQWRMSGFNLYDPVKQDRNDNPPREIPSY